MYTFWLRLDIISRRHHHILKQIILFSGNYRSYGFDGQIKEDQYLCIIIISNLLEKSAIFLFFLLFVQMLVGTLLLNFRVITMVSK